ncbi:MAG: 4Fe-4S binding protein [Candidatus Edwardsbacteria bacterium]
MAYVITDVCTSCGECVENCPNGAIVEGEGKYEITEDCVECGACLDACPVGAIKEV